jgi:hypothetical protein
MCCLQMTTPKPGPVPIAPSLMILWGKATQKVQFPFPTGVQNHIPQ